MPLLAALTPARQPISLLQRDRRDVGRLSWNARSRAPCRPLPRGAAIVTFAAPRDLYRLLNVGRDADLAHIKMSYRRRVRRCHPDIDDSPAAQKEFKAVTKAYEILSDPRLRGVYDSHGAKGVKAVLRGDPLPELRARKRWAGEASRGEDVRTFVELPLEESVLGCNRTVEFQLKAHCAHCEGSGFELGAEASDCDLCRGSGVVSRVRNLPDGSDPTTVTACPDCGGSGSFLEQYCTVCRGDGRTEETQSVGVKIPPGVSSGHWIKLRARGSVGRYGGERGDLYIGVQTQEHDFIQRCGSDLYSNLEVTFTDAILGVEASVATIWERRAKLAVPPGTQHGAVLALPGAGAPLLARTHEQQQQRGTHFFYVVIMLPHIEEVGEEELLLLQELKGLETRRREEQEARKEQTRRKQSPSPKRNHSRGSSSS